MDEKRVVVLGEFEALKIANKHNGESIETMLKAARDLGYDNGKDNRYRFQMLFENHYIEGAFCLGLPVSLTFAGKNRLAALQDMADEQAKKERQQRFSNKIAVASVLVSFIIFILGLLVEHYAGLITLLRNLFHL